MESDKIEAEAKLMERNPNAYIIRPPYLYWTMNNVYRKPLFLIVLCK